MTNLRINKTWLKTSYPSLIIKNRLKRYKSQAIDYYSIDWSKSVNNEEGS